MTPWQHLAGIRREYGDLSLDVNDVAVDPIEQFERWFSAALESETDDPTAMLLATVDEKGHPDARVVLLKSIKDGALLFYTNYQSAKSQQIQTTPFVALNFYWPKIVRQVRIRGSISRVNDEQSDEYFASRPKASQCSAVISPQSRTVHNRDELEEALNQMIAAHQQATVMRPIHWGGYQVIPYEFEFWQGRSSRLHDRIQYYQENGVWLCRRIAP